MMKQRLLKAFGASSFGVIITLITQLFTVPFFLYFWGVELYGEWLILSALPGYIAIADFGFTEYFVNATSKAVAKEQSYRAKIYAATGFYANIILSILFISFFFMLCLSLDFVDYFSISKLSLNDALIILFILSLYAFCCCITTYQTAIYRAKLQNHRSLIIINLIRVLELILTVCFVVLFELPLYAACGLFLARLLGVFYFRVDISKFLPDLSLSFKYFNFIQLKKGASTSIYYFLFPLTNLIQNQGVLLAISATTNPSFVALFSALRTISKASLQLVNSLNTATWQEITRLKVINSYETLRVLFVKSIFISLVFSISLCFVFVMFGDEILKIWSSGNLVDEMNLLNLFMVSSIINCTWSVFASFLRSSDQHSNLNYFYLAATVVLLIFVYLNPMLSDVVLIGYYLIAFDFVMLFSVIFIFNKVNFFRPEVRK